MAETVQATTSEEIESDDEGNVSYQILKEHSEELTLLLETSCTPLATKLSAEDFIGDKLHDEVVQRSLPISDGDRMNSLLTFIYHRMKKSKNPEKSMNDFKEIINDEAHSGLIKTLGKLISEIDWLV